MAQFALTSLQRSALIALQEGGTFGTVGEVLFEHLNRATLDSLVHMGLATRENEFYTITPQGEQELKG